MYLRSRDFERFIQEANLLQVISQDQSLRLLAESAAQEECQSYLKSKYNVDAEFTDTPAFSITATYLGGSRGELTGYAAYLDTATYTAASKAIVIYNTSVYICKLDTASPAGNFDATKWTLLGSEHDLFYVTLPYPAFDFYKNYNIGDRVFYKDKIYQAKKSTQTIDHIAVLNSVNQSSIPNKNVFPDDAAFGAQFWGTGVAYSFSGLNVNATSADFTAWSAITAYAIGDRVKYASKIWKAIATSTNKTPGDDITHWQSESFTKGDNRSQQILTVMVDISLYHLHKRIAPKNIPDLRVKAYDDSISWLKRANKGEITPRLTLLQPTQGTRIAYGGQVKNTNTY